MAETHVVSTLERLCADLEKRLEDYRALRVQAESDLIHLRSTIEFIDRTDGNTSASIPSVSVARVFQRGEAFALCLNALRQSGSELTTRDLTEVCMKAAKLDMANRAQRRAMMQYLIEVLTIHRGTGEIIMAGYRGRVCVWRLP